MSPAPPPEFQIKPWIYKTFYISMIKHIIMPFIHFEHYFEPSTRFLVVIMSRKSNFYYYFYVFFVYYLILCFFESICVECGIKPSLYVLVNISENVE